MLDIKVIATGSTGNCYRVSDGKTVVLLEAGISFTKIKKGLNYKLSEIDRCIVTHEHGDHACAVHDMMKRGINTMMSKGTAEALGVNSHRLEIVKANTKYIIKTFELLPLMAYHDVAEPLCYVLRSLETGESLFFATDTVRMPNISYPFDYLLVEVNHCLEVIKERLRSEKDVKPWLINRVLKTHMSLESFLLWFDTVDQSRLKELHIIHASDSNADDVLIEKVVKPMLKADTLFKVH